MAFRSFSSLFGVPVMRGMQCEINFPVGADTLIANLNPNACAPLNLMRNIPTNRPNTFHYLHQKYLPLPPLTNPPERTRKRDVPNRH